MSRKLLAMYFGGRRNVEFCNIDGHFVEIDNGAVREFKDQVDFEIEMENFKLSVLLEKIPGAFLDIAGGVE